MQSQGKCVEEKELSYLEAADGITLQEGVFASQHCPGLLHAFQVSAGYFF